jgi:hypothetical protein
MRKSIAFEYPFDSNRFVIKRRLITRCPFFKQFTIAVRTKLPLSATILVPGIANEVT